MALRFNRTKDSIELKNLQSLCAGNKDILVGAGYKKKFDQRKTLKDGNNPDNQEFQYFYYDM